MSTPPHHSPFLTRRQSPHPRRLHKKWWRSWMPTASFSLWFWVKILLALGVIGAISLTFLVIFYLRGIPSISELVENPPSESTIIYDREGNEIYSLYHDGKRTYVEYDKISQYMKDAIVSTEDKSFFTNPGIDLKGLASAGIGYIIGRTDRLRGASTISQQLIKNTLLSNEKTLKRKIQEAVLSYRLNSQLEKEKILELYLNTISFGNNASGIEEASKVYFWKSAKDLGPLGASILASLPKGPTQYSPYSHRDRLMGYTFVYSSDTPDATTTLETTDTKQQYRPLYDAFKDYLSSLSFSNEWSDAEICGVKKEYQKTDNYIPNAHGCTSVAYDNLTGFLSDIVIRESQTGSGTEDLALEYTFGRKDVVATNMFEDKKITPAEYRDILVNGLDFTFQRYKTEIRYPYFVFYIKEYLEETYGKDIDITNGLKVYTTIDPRLQAKAEEIVKKQVAINKGQGASSAALVSVDNTTGEILAMVWGPDYWDETHGGNNNMILANRQPWSSFKPLVYSLAVSKWPIGGESPIADVKTTFGKWTPNNYDEKFKGIMALKNALAYSRNIPAVKMFYLAGGEDSIVDFAHTIGLDSLRSNAGYGAPLAMGTAEVKPIEMLSAYSVLANGGTKKQIVGITKIEDSDRNVLEEIKENHGTSVFSPAASYIITQILSDNSARPESDFWRNALTLNGWRVAAAKTGTSNKEFRINGTKKILPWDLWTIGYTPQITTVVWAGNVDGKATGPKADGLTCAAPIWKSFMDYAHKDLPKQDFPRPKSGLYDVTISRLSGKLANENTPANARRKTLMAVKPTAYDSGVKTVQVDKLCNGPVTPATPEDDIISVFYPNDKPIIDGYDPKWTEGFFTAAKMTVNSGSLISDTPCDRPDTPGTVAVTLRTINDTLRVGRNLVEATWDGDRAISHLRISQGDTLKYEVNYDSDQKAKWSQRATIVLDADEPPVLTLEAVDIFGAKYTTTLTVNIPWVISSTGGASDTSPTASPPVSTGPTRIHMSNPVEWDTTKNLYKGDPMNIRFSVESATVDREISVSVDAKSIYTASVGDTFVVPLSSASLEVGDHTVRVKIIDGKLASDEKSFTLTVLPR